MRYTVLHRASAKARWIAYGLPTDDEEVAAARALRLEERGRSVKVVAHQTTSIPAHLMEA